MEIYMQRCIELALNGFGYTAPNPMVGCVIVYEDKIIGEGYHIANGQPHAEVNAIKSVKDHSLLPYSTLYVSLEPCCHHGKTPPCTDLIIEKRIKNVVVGMKDPFPEVSGKGIDILKSIGINVIVGMMEKECAELNKRFITYHTKKRPYIVLKWAQTADGYIDTEKDLTKTSRPNWITSQNLKMLVHKWRHQEQAILVGTKTALADNPKLNVREWVGVNPLRLVIDQHIELPRNLSIFDNSIQTIIFNEKIEKQECNNIFIKLDFSGKIENQIIEELYNRKIQSAIIEGGRVVLQTFINSNLWDEARVFHGNQYFGKGTKAPDVCSDEIYTYNLGNEKVSYLINKT